MTAVFYVSGHGFGHASRDLELIRALRTIRPDLSLVIRTAVPAWFFDHARPDGPPLHVQELEADTGIRQIDSLRMDLAGTAQTAAGFYATFSSRVEVERILLRELRASVVVGDAPALAFAAARAAGVPSVLFANFTWDWIYGALPGFSTAAPGVVDIVREAYSTAALALRLPLHGGFEGLDPVRRDIPLVARRSRRTPDDVRRLLGIGRDRPLVLASFGRYGARLPSAAAARRGDFTLLVTDQEAGVELDAPPFYRRLPGASMRALGLRYEDIVASADVVVSKAGYGIVSECIANRTPLLYTSRGPFIEQDVFVREMPAWLPVRRLPQDDLEAGRWGEAVRALARQPWPDAPGPVNGAEVAARAILEVMRDQRGR